MRHARLFVWLLGSLPVLSAAAPPIGVFTIVDGETAVIRDSVRFAAAEGLRVQPDDIIHTGERANVTRIEFAEGGALDLGPATRLLLRPRWSEPRSERPSRIYVSQGWIKLTVTPADRIGLATPRLDLAEVAGTTVALIQPEAAFVFVESGSAKLVERADGQPPRRHALAAGQAYDRRGAEAGAAGARPPADRIKSLPRSFTDTLPRRAAVFRDAQVAPLAPTAIAYEDVAPWINAERPLRPAFVQRWSAKARDARFRAALITDLRMHPEWDRVLYPEKYIVKKDPDPVPKPPASAARGDDTPAPVATAPEAPAPAPQAAEAAPAEDPTRKPLRPWETRR